ncbi:MAG: iron-sulfur cluster assembly scaffold protein [Sphingomonadaceae bacterium]
MTGTAPGLDKLYTPGLLALAVELARYPFDPLLPLQGEALSRTCGSKVRVGLELDSEGNICTAGMQVASCAVGQASAAIFASRAKGLGNAGLERDYHHLKQWLGGNAPPPDWAGFPHLVPAREYPARHGAILLPWRAARDALCNLPSHG